MIVAEYQGKQISKHAVSYLYVLDCDLWNMQLLLVVVDSSRRYRKVCLSLLLLWCVCDWHQIDRAMGNAGCIPCYNAIQYCVL